MNRIYRYHGKIVVSLTFKVLDASVFTRVLSSNWVIPFHAQPFAFGSFHLSPISYSTQPPIVGKPLSNVKFGSHWVGAWSWEWWGILSKWLGVCCCEFSNLHGRLTPKFISIDKIEDVITLEAPSITFCLLHVRVLGGTLSFCGGYRSSPDPLQHLNVSDLIRAGRKHSKQLWKYAHKVFSIYNII